MSGRWPISGLCMCQIFPVENAQTGRNEGYTDPVATIQSIRDVGCKSVAVDRVTAAPGVWGGNPNHGYEQRERKDAASGQGGRILRGIHNGLVCQTSLEVWTPGCCDTGSEGEDDNDPLL